MKPTMFTAWLEGYLDATSSTKAHLNNYDLDTIKKKLSAVNSNTEKDTPSAKFCTSLQGVFEIENPSSLSDIQVEKIKNKLVDANAEIPPVPYVYVHSGPTSSSHNKYRC